LGCVRNRKSSYALPAGMARMALRAVPPRLATTREPQRL